MVLDESRRTRALSFGAIARDYDRARPEPPAEALDWLLPGGASAIAEVGAGTGLLTRHLTERVDEVFAVEPDPRMRAVLAEKAPRAHVLDGRGEDIPLPDGSVDAVLAASSWHWVDQAKGFAEVARVLRPGGTLALLWTGPDRSVSWVWQVMAHGKPVDEEERGQIVADRHRRHRPEMPEGAPFGEPERRTFRSSRSITKEELIELPGSYSEAITVAPEERRARREQLERFVTTELEFTDGRIELPLGCVTWRAFRH